MLTNYSIVKPKTFEFNNRFTSGNYTLKYSRHANVPRINRIANGLVIKESRIISAFTLDRVDKLINKHIIKMCVKLGKWKFFIESEFGLIMFIVLTRKAKNSNHVIAEFHSSYTMDTPYAELTKRKTQDTILLDDFLICEENQTVSPTKEEYDEYILKETKETTARVKKKTRNDKKWNKKKKRWDERYTGGFQKMPHYKGRSKVYLPTNTNTNRKAVKAKKIAEKLKYDNYYGY